MKLLFVVSAIWLIKFSDSMNVKYPWSSLPKRNTAPGSIDMTKVIKELKRFIIHHIERCRKDNNGLDILSVVTKIGDIAAQFDMTNTIRELKRHVFYQIQLGLIESDKTNHSQAILSELQSILIAEMETRIKTQDNKLQEMQQNMTELLDKNKDLESIQHELSEDNKDLNTKIASLTAKIDQLLITTTPSPPAQPTDCEDLPKGSNSGIYKIYPAGEPGFNVYCEMDKADGGWVVLQRRMDGKQDFFLNWIDYKKGFGDQTKEFWLGNDNIHVLTNSRCYKLRIDLESYSGEKRFITYSVMRLSDEASQYRLSLGPVNLCDGGTLDDSMRSTPNKMANGVKFSTKDVDNDNHAPSHCAKTNNKGGWWYDACSWSNLNGLRRDATAPYTIFWNSWLGIKGLKSTSMMIKRQK